MIFLRAFHGMISCVARVPHRAGPKSDIDIHNSDIVGGQYRKPDLSGHHTKV
jgi:hypothetical protein